MGVVSDFLSGIHRYFPTMMTTTLIVVGILLAKINWILVGLGSLITALIVLVLQWPFSGSRMGTSAIRDWDLNSAAILEVCGLLPAATGGTYTRVPSLWFALMSFYMAYILRNAISVYKTKPATAAAAASSSAQHRMGVGIISILTTVILFLVLAVARMTTSCEHWGGAILGIIIGGGIGVGWWYALAAAGTDYYPDIHSVMIGLQPGPVHGSAVACARTN